MIGYYIKFDEIKAINAVLLIAEQLKRKDFHKIFKVLYFADREHLAFYGRPITGDNYIAMDDGPVPSKLYDIFKSVRGDSYFSDDGTFEQYFSVLGRDIIKLNRKPDLKTLSKTDIKFLNEAVMKYGEMSHSRIRAISHDYAWTGTAKNNTITFENILRESGADGDNYIEYVEEQRQLTSLCE